MRSARLRHVGACPEDVDYRARRGLDKALFQSLLTGKWITDKRNLIITGPCGVGKTWLGCALAQAACRDGVTVVYRRMPRLFEELEMALGDGRFPRLFRSITKAQLLILDDWGPDRLTATQRRDLMEIVEERYGRGSTMITSQLPIKAWHDVIGEPTFADAILDRIVHNAYDADWFRDALKDKGIRPCIPGRKSRGKAVRYDKRRYRRRNRIEIMFGRLKNWRRVATRYDRCPKVFLSAVALAATVMFWL